MEIFQLKEFTTLVGTLSFNETAFCLDVSTSALSRHIQQLEDELNCKLFTRATRSVSLTEAGKVFLPHAAMILQDYEAGMNKLKEYLHKEEHRLTLGVYYDFLEYEIDKSIDEFRISHPEYETNLIIGSIKELEIGFKNKLFNIYTTVNDFAMENPNFLKDDCNSIKAVVPANSHFAENKKLMIKELAGTPLFLPEEDILYTRKILNCFKKEGVAPIILHNGRFEDSIDFIKKGMGIGLFPFRLNKEKQNNGLVFIDFNPEIKFDYGICFRDNLTKAESAFVNFSIEYVKKRHTNF